MEVDELLELARKLSEAELRRLVEDLLDILLSSVNLEKVPDDVGWRIAEAFREGRATDPLTLRDLAFAVSLAEPAKLSKIVSELRCGR